MAVVPQIVDVIAPGGMLAEQGDGNRGELGQLAGRGATKKFRHEFTHGKAGTRKTPVANYSRREGHLERELEIARAMFPPKYGHDFFLFDAFPTFGIRRAH